MFEFLKKSVSTVDASAQVQQPVCAEKPVELCEDEFVFVSGAGVKRNPTPTL